MAAKVATLATTFFIAGSLFTALTSIVFCCREKRTKDMAVNTTSMIMTDTTDTNTDTDNTYSIESVVAGIDGLEDSINTA
jgi:hypothetical protein